MIERVKPSKHCLLGLGDGNKKLINILNHFGHSVGYNRAEELETELAMKSQRHIGQLQMESSVSGLATGLALDNYDENAETLSGSGTLHHTVSITYQNIDDTSVIRPTSTDSQTPSGQGGKQKRSFWKSTARYCSISQIAKYSWVS